jgi:hypothetical protein
MDINLSVIIGVFFANSGACLLQCLSQEIDLRRGKILPRGSTIPNTDQKFLHWQDFETQTWGDLIGLAAVQIAFVQLAMAGYISVQVYAVLGVVSIVSAIGFAVLNMRQNHKPDWGYPEAGKISLGGISHLPYFGVNIAIACADIFYLLTGKLEGELMWIALAGGAIYIASMITDIRVGNFDPPRWKNISE